MPGDTSMKDFAIIISDSTKAHQFINSNTIDSIINRDIAKPYYNNWRGNDSLPNSLFMRFRNAITNFKNEGYPEEYLETYAAVYMLKNLDMGIRMQQKVNGIFKEINFEEVTDPVTGAKHYKIKICQ